LFDFVRFVEGECDSPLRQTTTIRRRAANETRVARNYSRKFFPDGRIYNKEGFFEKYLLESQEPRAKSQEPRAKSQEPRAKSQEILPGRLPLVKRRIHYFSPPFAIFSIS
jgi:hypothetical protein